MNQPNSGTSTLCFAENRSAYFNSTEKNWQVTVADSDLKAVQLKVGAHSHTKAVAVDVTNESVRKQYITSADLVISLMPPHLHYLIAVDCITLKKHLLTASYLDEDIKKLSPDIKQSNVLFLYEMGLFIFCFKNRFSRSFVHRFFIG